MKKLLLIAAILWSSSAMSQDIDWNKLAEEQSSKM